MCVCVCVREREREREPPERVFGAFTDPDELRPFFLQRVTPKPRHESLPVLDGPAEPDTHRAPEKGEEI
jgi:uncharacterized protein YndB with AHSA1/START domain